MRVLLDPSALNDFRVVAQSDLFDQLTGSQLLSGQLIDMRNRHAAHRLADELHLVTLDVLDHHNALLGQEMQSQVRHSVTQD